MPTFPDTDVFAPELVSWYYHASTAWTLRAVLTIDPPGHPDAPMEVLRPVPGCGVPMGDGGRSASGRLRWPGPSIRASEQGTRATGADT
jgi:hypothetical protein